MTRREFNEPCCSNGSQTKSSTLYRRFKILRLQGHIDVVVADMHAIACLTILSTYNIYCVCYHWNVNIVLSARTLWLGVKKSNTFIKVRLQQSAKISVANFEVPPAKKFRHCKQTRVSIHLRSKSTSIRVKEFGSVGPT